MTSFVNDNGEYLDLDKEVGFTKQAASFYDFKIKGDVSITMDIPNTPPNRRVLNYYGPAQIQVGLKTAFTMMDSGNAVSRGFIVVTGSDEETISAFYISGNSNWFQRVQFNLKEMMFDDSYTVSYKDVDSRMSATEGIIFPFFDLAYNGMRRGNAFFLGPRRVTDFVPQSSEVLPCIYLHTILKGIAETSGLKISGDLLEDVRFKSMIVTGSKLSCSSTIVSRTSLTVGLSSSVSPSDGDVITLDRVINAGDQTSWTGTRYYAPFNGTYRVDMNFYYTAGGGRLLLSKGFANGSADQDIAIDPLPSLTGPRKASYWVNMSKGDYVYFYADVSSSMSLSTRSLVTIQLESVLVPSRYINSLSTSICISRILPSFVVPDMKAVDFIKFLAQYFSCVVSYDDNSETVSINKLSRFERADADDWSDYFISYSEKRDTGAAQNNLVVMKQGDEEDNGATAPQGYGGGNIETTIDTIQTRDYIKFPFAGSWDAANKTSIEGNPFMPYIKKYEISEAERWPYSAVTNATRASFTVAATHPFAKGDTVWIQSASGAYEGYGVVSVVTATTIIFEQLFYLSNDSGTLVKVDLKEGTAIPRLMIAKPGLLYSDIGFEYIPIYVYAVFREQDDPSAWVGSDLFDFVDFVCAAWFDKPIMNLPIDAYSESAAIDKVRGYNITAGEMYYGPLKKILENPIIEAEFILPTAKFQSFNFDRWIYLNTKDFTGYFFVHSIDEYHGPDTPVRVKLLYGN